MKLIRLDPVAADDAAAGPLAGAPRVRPSLPRRRRRRGAATPQRLAELIAQLNAANEDDRYAARVDLRAAGDPAIAACFAALAAAETPEAPAPISWLALADMRPAVDEPLLAVLADARGPLRRDAAELAGHLQARRRAAVARRARRVADRRRRSPPPPKPPSPSSASRAVARRSASARSPPARRPRIAARRRRRRTRRPLVVLESRKPTSSPSAEFTAPQLRTLAAARLARAAGRSRRRARPRRSPRRAVIRALEEAALLEPRAVAPQLQASSRRDVARRAERRARRRRRRRALRRRRHRSPPSSAAAAIPSSSPPPTACPRRWPPRCSARCARCASPRCRPSCSWRPPHRFPGSSGVPEALWYFAAGAGDPVAIAAAPVFTRASDWAGQLRGLGYEATPAATGRDALAAALDPAASPAARASSCSTATSASRSCGEIIYQLRTSDRTARVPVLIAASVPHLADAQRIADSDPLHARRPAAAQRRAP